jgi:NADPH-dependent ferric siderophore reductase
MIDRFEAPHGTGRAEPTWSTRLWNRFLIPATVAGTGNPTPSLREVRLTGPAVAKLPWTPGQHVKVFFGPGLTNRDYSIWDRDEDGGIALRIFLHGDQGAGAHWAGSVRVGDRVSIGKPEGHLVARAGAAYHLFVGDDTAAVAFGAIARALPAASAVHGVIEVDAPAQRPELPRGDRLRWIYRRGQSAVASRRLLDAVRDLPLPAEPGVAYVAGEARTCQLIRRHLVQDRGWSRRDVVMTAFWH